jgi:hypothetical protein
MDSPVDKHLPVSVHSSNLQELTVRWFWKICHSFAPVSMKNSAFLLTAPEIP